MSEDRIFRSIPENEINACVITIYPPPKHSSDYINTIDPGLLLVRDRFVYFANSDEYIEYVMQNPDKIKGMFGIDLPKGMPTEINEHVIRGNAYHFSQTSAVGMSIRFDDKTGFKKTIKVGKGFQNKLFEKKLNARYVIVIDFMMNSETFKKSIKGGIQSIANTAEEHKGTHAGRIAEKALQRMKEDAQVQSEIGDDEDEPAPELVQLPTNPFTSEITAAVPPDLIEQEDLSKSTKSDEGWVSVSNDE